MENDSNSVEKNGFQWGQRHMQAIYLFFCSFILYALRVNLSIAIIAMTNKSSTNQNFTELTWDESTKGLVLSAFFWGYPLTQIHGGQIAQKYGAKYVLVFSIGICAISTTFTPLSAIYGGAIAMCANQMVQGMAQGAVFPAVNILLSKWAPLSEKSRINSFVYSGATLGSTIILPVSGLLVSSVGGWPSVFYTSGFATSLWVLVWCMFGANCPEDHRSISTEEKDYITKSLSESTSKSVLPTPWRDIFLSIPMWTLIVTHCTQNWSTVILMAYMPSYFSQVLKFNIKSNGYLSALPYLFKWILSIVFSWISDYTNTRGLMTPTLQKKIGNSVAHFGGAVALFSLYFFDTSVLAASILLSAVVILNGGVFSGFMTNHLDLAPNFAGTLFGITNSIASLTSILGPVSVGFMVTDSTNKDQWGLVFLYSSLTLFAGNLFYVLCGSAEIQPWNQPRKTNEVEGHDNTTFMN